MVVNSNARQADVLRLDVGGTNFHVSRHVLASEPNSMLNAMFSGRFHLDTQADGTIFIDRFPPEPLFVILILIALPQGPPALPTDIGLPSWGVCGG